MNERTPRFEAVAGEVLLCTNNHSSPRIVIMQSQRHAMQYQQFTDVATAAE